jgi:hypothetical protein
MKGTRLALNCVYVLIFLVTQGCGGSSSNDSQAPSSQNQGSGNQSTELEGSWLKSCGVADPTDPSSHYDIVTISFSGNSFNSDIKNYTDAGCSTPLAFSPNPTASGTFIVGNSVALAAGGSATQIDTHINTYNGAPFDIDTYGIFRIDTDTLYMEDDTGALDGSSPALRPDSLDFNRPFIRQ